MSILAGGGNEYNDNGRTYNRIQEAYERGVAAERRRCAACCHVALDPDRFIMGGPAMVARQIKALIESGGQPK